jgi:hypothetical protein
LILYYLYFPDEKYPKNQLLRPSSIGIEIHFSVK